MALRQTTDFAERLVGLGWAVPDFSTLSTRRFLRPICYQNIPDALLPGDMGEATNETRSTGSGSG